MAASGVDSDRKAKLYVPPFCPALLYTLATTFLQIIALFDRYHEWGAFIKHIRVIRYSTEKKKSYCGSHRGE